MNVIKFKVLGLLKEGVMLVNKLKYEYYILFWGWGTHVLNLIKCNMCCEKIRGALGKTLIAKVIC
jgi:hypothetical protein